MRMEARNIQALAILIILMATAISALVSIPKVVWAYTPRDPIDIDGNGDFTSANGVAGGSGVQLDPYVIENWDINTSNKDGIRMRNTDAWFVIRDSYIHSIETNFVAILLQNVSNGFIQNVDVHGFWQGIQFESSSNIAVAECTASSHEIGIVSHFSTEVVIDHNNVYGNVIGIILTGSTKALVAANQASNNTHGIYILISSNATLAANNATSNLQIGIFAIQSSDLRIVGNNVSSNSHTGVLVQTSTDVTVEANNASFCGRDGILIGLSSSNVTVRANYVSGNPTGIDIDRSVGNIVHHNVIRDNARQASDNMGSENLWDFGYPDGGNWWCGLLQGPQPRRLHGPRRHRRHALRD